MGFGMETPFFPPPSFFFFLFSRSMRTSARQGKHRDPQIFFFPLSPTPLTQRLGHGAVKNMRLSSFFLFLPSPPSLPIGRATK